MEAGVPLLPRAEDTAVAKNTAKPMKLDPLFDAAGKTPRRAGRALIAAYRYGLSPLIGYECRHLPTCSAYGDEALDRFGLWAGGWMTLGRLCRCHPFGGGGYDPP